MSDLLKDLEALDEKPKAKVEPKKTEFESGTLSHLKNFSGKLYAVKNTADYDLTCDWDLPLMPEDLKPEFDKYLSDKYNQYKLNETMAKVKMVVIFVQGRSINFLHEFMTEKRIPVLATIQEGMSSVIKSQFCIPAGQTVVCSEEQISSIKRYEKKRSVSKNETGSWYGILAIKEIPVDVLPKLKYSMVTSEDVKNNNFEILNKKKEVRGTVTGVEYSNELDDLI